MNACRAEGTLFRLIVRRDSKDAFNKLLLEGVIVRSLTVYKMPNYLRVSVGLPEENQIFLEKIESALSK